MAPQGRCRATRLLGAADQQHVRSIETGDSANRREAGERGRDGLVFTSPFCEEWTGPGGTSRGQDGITRPGV